MYNALRMANQFSLLFFDTLIITAASEPLFLNKFITSNGNPRKFFTACAKGI